MSRDRVVERSPAPDHNHICRRAHAPGAVVARCACAIHNLELDADDRKFRLQVGLPLGCAANNKDAPDALLCEFKA